MYFFRISNQFPHFPGQQENETIELVIKKNIFALGSAILSFVLTLLVVLVLLWVTFFSGFVTDGPIYTGVLVITGVIAFYGLIIFLHRYLDETMDMIVVTSQRIVYVNQKGILARDIAGVSLNAIEDVHSSIEGLWASMFRYGTVEIRTASDKNDIQIEYISSPSLIVQRVLDTQSKKLAMDMEFNHDLGQEIHNEKEGLNNTAPSPTPTHGKVIDLRNTTNK